MSGIDRHRVVFPRQPSIPALLALLLLLLQISSSALAAPQQKNLAGIYDGGLQPGHYLQWHGKPILLVGDSVTQGWMETGKDFNYKGYIDALADRGLNLLMLWSFMGTSAEQQRKDKRIGYDAPEIWPWLGSTDARDITLDKLNPAYFSLLGKLVGYAEKRGIIVLITVHDGWVKGRFDSHPFNRSMGNGPLQFGRQYVELADYDREMPAALDQSWNWRQKNQFFQERFCDRLITALAPFSNVMYEMFNEGGWYDKKERYLHEQHFLNFFRNRCNNLLFTNSDHITDDAPHPDGKVNAISLHGNWLNRFTDFEKAFRNKPPKPYLLSEPVPGWDGDPDFMASILRSVIETTLTGAGWVNQNDPSFAWAAPTKMNKKSESRDRAYELAGHISHLLNSGRIPFFNMAPAGHLSDTGICLAWPGEEYLVYTPDSTLFSVDLSDARGSLEVEWYLPETGIYRHELPVQGGQQTVFRAPFANGAILHLYNKTAPR